MKCKSPNVPLHDELLTWTSQLRTGQPSICAMQVWHIAYCITCTTKLINTTGRLVRAHLDFCTSWVKHNDFCWFKGVTYDAITLCYELISFLHWFPKRRENFSNLANHKLCIFHFACAKRPYFHFRSKIWRHHRVPRPDFLYDSKISAIRIHLRQI